MYRIALRPFMDLLPYRIEQALGDLTLSRRLGRDLRARRVRRRRSKMAGAYIDQALQHPDSIGAREGDRRRRLYIDLAVISRDDAGTGIQRVVRALALALRDGAVEQWDVRFVSAFRHSSYHVISWPGKTSAAEIAPRDPIIARPGDVFIGLDFSLDAVRRHRRQLAQFRQNGGELWFLVCDLLPVQRPEWFSPNNVIRYKAWLEIIASVADGFLCISAQTEIELRATLADRFDLKEEYKTRVIPMGHDIMASMPKEHVAVVSAPEDAGVYPDRFDMAASFTLMVGTLEPRKGHADILSAFDAMWDGGSNERLVLVGRMGWRVAGLRERIVEHPRYGDQLLWFDDVGDAELERIYSACEGFIIASHAEGFGLPLIEALGHRKPVLARDLPIFRIHEECGVRYFPVNASPQEMAQHIVTWLATARAGHANVIPPSGNWADSARVILTAISSSEASALSTSSADLPHDYINKAAGVKQFSI